MRRQPVNVVAEFRHASARTGSCGVRSFQNVTQQYILHHDDTARHRHPTVKTGFQVPVRGVLCAERRSSVRHVSSVFCTFWPCQAGFRHDDCKPVQAIHPPSD
jgi:hypothetical protein